MKIQLITIIAIFAAGCTDSSNKKSDTDSNFKKMEEDIDKELYQTNKSISDSDTDKSKANNSKKCKVKV